MSAAVAGGGSERREASSGVPSRGRERASAVDADDAEPSAEEVSESWQKL
jgi:hypothetical protein